MKVFIDIGHTRIKLQREDQAVEYYLLEDWKSLPKMVADASSIVVSCALNHPLHTRLHTELQRSSTTKKLAWLNTTPSNGTLKIAYHAPATFGIDRYLSLLALSEHAPLVLVSIGSAATVDVLDQQGEHLGGWILPSLSGTQQYFHQAFQFDQQTAIPTEATSLGYYTLGKSTDQAIGNGYFTMLCHWLISLFDNPALLGLKEGKFFITGGGCEPVLAHLQSGWQHQENLVIEGLKKYFL